MKFFASKVRGFIKSFDERRYKKNLHYFLRKNIDLNSTSSLILIWELGGFPAILERNAIFSIALNLRGFKTHFLLCDGTSEACIQRGIEQQEKVENWKLRCKPCKESMLNSAKKYNLDYSFTGNYINAAEQNQFQELSNSLNINTLLKYEYCGINVGQLAWGSFNRYMKGLLFAVDDLQEGDIKILRKYFYAALVNTHIANKVIDQLKPSAILTSHGVYVDYAPIVMVAYEKGIPVTSWASGYQKYAHYFTVPKEKNKINLRSVSSIVWEQRKNKPLAGQEQKRLDTFFQSRYFGKEAHDIAIQENPQDKNALKKQLNITNDFPIVCLFTHVNWDACFDMGMMIFDSANQWVIESLQKMQSIPNVNWIIRVHPGEKTDGSLFTSDDLIRKNFKQFPENVKVLWSDSVINTYSLFQLIDIGVTIFGTIGVELPLFGKPVIAAGSAHFSHKGFSLDMKTKEEYFSLLNNIQSIKPLTNAQVELARRYAYLYFIQRQAVVDIVDKKVGHWGALDIRLLDQLLPGKNPTIDAICDSILKGIDCVL